MKKVTVALIAALFAANAFAGMAFLKRQYVSGMNKICVYDHLGSELAITIKSYQICQPSINV